MWDIITCPCSDTYFGHVSPDMWLCCLGAKLFLKLSYRQLVEPQLTSKFASWQNSGFSGIYLRLRSIMSPSWHIVLELSRPSLWYLHRCWNHRICRNHRRKCCNCDRGGYLKTSNDDPDTSIWVSYQILKIAGCACAGNVGNVFPNHRMQWKPLVNDPGMHHGTCVTHVPWCMSRSLTRGGGENAPGIPGACATRNFTYLVRGPWGRASQ